MSIIIFYLSDDRSPAKYEYKDIEFELALRMCETLRRQGATHVCMSTQLENSVGRPGVDSIENGYTPDGYDYEWSKQHRGAGPVRPTPPSGVIRRECDPPMKPK